MLNCIIPHQFNQSLICQLSEDTVIGGRLIPAHYCNATQMCKGAGKRFNNYTRNERTKAYLKALAESTRISADLLIIENESSGTNEERGSWVHPEVAISLAAWISPEFEVWANRVLRAVINGDFRPLTEEAATAQRQLQELWQEIRDGSKAAFWNLTDATKLYLEQHPEVSESYRKFVYSNCQDAVNRGILGKMAKKIRSELQVKDLLRDHYKVEALERIKTVQHLAAIQVTNKDIEPFQAVKNTLEFCGYDPIDYQ